MIPDSELLHRYVALGDEAAFADLVRRHADLVYSIALRVTGNAVLAEDVTQAVFTKLVRQARGLGSYLTLVGWLHTTARYTAINTVRGEARRRAREQEAFAMQDHAVSPAGSWNEIRPLLDEAVGQLREVDRQALMLRYFNGLSHQEVGALLGLTENSANKRIERALDKLRLYFTRRGVTTTSAILAVAISANSVQAAPVGLVGRSVKASLAGATAAGWGGTFFTALIFMNQKIKIILAVAFLALLAIYGTIKFQAVEEPPATAPANPRPTPPAATNPPAVKSPLRVAAPAAASVAPVTVPAAAPAPAPVATAPVDPRLDVTTAMTGLVDLLESGDFVTAIDTYFQVPPNMTGAQLAAMIQQTPDFPNTLQMMINATKAAQTSVPTYDVTGELATYRLAQPTNGKTMVRWKRINGFWYVDAFE